MSVMSPSLYQTLIFNQNIELKPTGLLTGTVWPRKCLWSSPDLVVLVLSTLSTHIPDILLFVQPDTTKGLASWHRSLFEWQSQFGVYVRSVYWDNECWCWDIIRTWIILPSLAFLRVSRTSPIVRLGAGDSSCSSSEGRRTSKSPGMPSISEDISSLSISAKLWLFLLLFHIGESILLFFD